MKKFFNYYNFTKNIITFFHHFLTFFKEKSTFLKILTTIKWWSFDHHFPPSLLISNFIIVLRYFVYEPLGWSIRTFKIWKWFIMDDINTEQYANTYSGRRRLSGKHAWLANDRRELKFAKAPILMSHWLLASRLRFERLSTVVLYECTLFLFCTRESIRLKEYASKLAEKH